MTKVLTEDQTNLFTEDQNARIQLKPSVNWNTWLSSVFPTGKCTCHRCLEHDHDQSTYEYKHTFNTARGIVHRRFSVSLLEDLETRLKAAWISYYQLEKTEQGNEPEEDRVEKFKAQLVTDGVEETGVWEFTLNENQELAAILIQEIAGVELREGRIIFPK